MHHCKGNIFFLNKQIKCLFSICHAIKIRLLSGALGIFLLSIGKNLLCGIIILCTFATENNENRFPQHNI